MLSFREHLQKRLSEELPGHLAHAKMTFPGRQVQYPSPPPNVRRAGVLLLFYPSEGGLMLPLIQRPHYEGVHSGQMALPGGKIEPEDQDIVQTALRETEEEIGVVVNRAQVIGQLSELYIPPSNTLVTPVVAFAPHQPQFYPDPKEVDKVYVARLNALTDPANHHKSHISIKEKYQLEIPCFVLDGHVVWGATAMMLAELLMLLPEEG